VGKNETARNAVENPVVNQAALRAVQIVSPFLSRFPDAKRGKSCPFSSRGIMVFLIFDVTFKAVIVGGIGDLGQNPM
jgi:hypothetical protein